MLERESGDLSSPETGVIKSLNSLLNLIEDWTSFQKDLIAHFNPKVAGAILQAIKFGTLNSVDYYRLSQISPEKFRDFFLSIDFSELSKKGITIEGDFLQIAACEFSAALIETLSRYKIFDDILADDFSLRYKQVMTGKGFSVFMNEDGFHFLKIGKEYFPEENFCDAYYRAGRPFLFFEGENETFILNTDTSKLIILEGEREDVTRIDGEVYITLAYPNCDNPTISKVYCVERDFTYSNTIVGMSGHIFGVEQIGARVCVIESGAQPYIGYYKGEKARKSRNTIRVCDFDTGEEVTEIEGIYDGYKMSNEGMFLNTRRGGLIEREGDYKYAHFDSSIFVANSSGEGRRIDIEESRIIEKIGTHGDVIYIFRDYDNSLAIISSIQGKAEGKFFGGIPIAHINSIEHDSANNSFCSIWFTYSTGKKGKFLSIDFLSQATH